MTELRDLLQATLGDGYAIERELGGGGMSRVVPSRPRHDVDEMRRLFKGLHHPDVDPRFALAFEIGGEQRLGQVLRCRRSHLVLPAVDLDVIRSLEPGPVSSGSCVCQGQGTSSPHLSC